MAINKLLAIYRKQRRKVCKTRFNRHHFGNVFARTFQCVANIVENARIDICKEIAIECGEIVPCVFGSALKFEGIEDLLEVLGRYTEEPEYGEDFGARIYKIANAEDGSRLVMRLGEQDGMRRRLKWPQKVKLLNMLEDEEGEAETMEVRPFEMITIGIDC